MKYYKDGQNKIFAYEPDGSQDRIIPSGQIAITEAEAHTILSPVVTVNPNDAINAQISALEAGVFLNRGSRELEMRLIEQAASGNVQVLAAQPYYVKLKALDEQIRALRGLLK